MRNLEVVRGSDLRANTVIAAASGPASDGVGAITSADRVNCNISYQLLSNTTSDGSCVPMLIGEGRFAKVYKAWQRSDGHNIRAVAIKILHNTARYVEQNLFEQEIAMLKELSSVARTDIIKILDVVHLGPMIMCGCGRVYHPLCPECGRHLLQRRDVENREYPSLACPNNACGYDVSAMNIEIQYRKLTSPPAKICCKEGARAMQGTIVNFVNRPAVIMDLQDTRLDEVAEQRRQYFHQRCQQYTTDIADVAGHRPTGKWQKERDQQRLQRAMALDKMMMMVQIAEAVAGLHQELAIIHKDLTPDNIMVNFNARSGQGGSLRKSPLLSFQDVLNDLISYPTFGVKIIDFGLADRQKLSRKWYEEKDIINAGMDKAPYFSPEALQRTQRLNHRLQIDPELKRFIIPPELKNSIISVHEGDTLAFQWDLLHKHELLIKRVEAGPEPGVFSAYFEGHPPPPEQQRQSQLVLPLGEAHDVYSVGALFYYLLTENHLQVQRLGGFVSVIQTHPCELTAAALLSRHGDSYIAHRDAIPIPDKQWRDRMMELILRAMVRGRQHSFSTSRSERGPGPAQDLLWETKRLYRSMQAYSLSEPVVRTARLAAFGTAASIVIMLAGFQSLRSGVQQTRDARSGEQCKEGAGGRSPLRSSTMVNQGAKSVVPTEPSGALGGVAAMDPSRSTQQSLSVAAQAASKKPSGKHAHSPKK